jgi:hypothetical protein
MAGHKVFLFNVTVPIVTSSELYNVSLHCIKCHNALTIPGSSRTVQYGHTMNLVKYHLPFEMDIFSIVTLKIP